MAKADDQKSDVAGWLLKTEPTHYSYSDLEKEGKTTWDGVTNNLALSNIRRIKKGDSLIIYHTGEEKAIAGLAEAISQAYPDPKANDPKIVVVDIKAKKKAARRITLADVKKLPDLASSPLVRLPRLSVMPLTGKEWKKLTELAGL
ncbi:MAG TPA: EVE domain-containing protein [Blastocatellia bacterium]|nr:EVE domain-containing protein [Blastocatellia bacterium]